MTAQNILVASLSALLTTLAEKHFCNGKCDFWKLHLSNLKCTIAASLQYCSRAEEPLNIPTLWQISSVKAH